MDSEQRAVFFATRAFGLARSRELLVRDLEQRGLKVAVAARGVGPADFSEWDSPPEEYHSIGTSRSVIGWSDARFAYHIRGISRGANLVHGFNVKPCFIAALAMPSGIRGRSVATLTGLGRAFSPAAPVVPRLVAHSIAKSFRVVVVQNPDDRVDFVAALGGGAEVDMRVIPGSGVDAERYRPATSRARVASPPHVLMIGRLTASKGVADFLDAAQIAGSRRPIRFSLAGESDTSAPDRIPQESVIRASRRADVEFLGRVSDVPGLLRTADLVVAPSRVREGYPRAVLEAHSSAVPVLTTNVPGCRAAVLDGVDGRIVDPGSPDALADAILELLADPRTLQAMGEAARSRVERDLSTNAIAAQYSSIYDDVLSARP